MNEALERIYRRRNAPGGFTVDKLGDLVYVEGLSPENAAIVEAGLECVAADLWVKRGLKRKIHRLWYYHCGPGKAAHEQH